MILFKYKLSEWLLFLKRLAGCKRIWRTRFQPSTDRIGASLGSIGSCWRDKYLTRFRNSWARGMMSP